MRAVITAGARIDGAYASAAGTNVKALAPVRGRTMLSLALEAARGAGARAIAVVGGDDVRAACGSEVDRVVAETASGAQNVQLALRAWPDDDALLYLTSDLPYIAAQSVSGFVARCGPAVAIALCSHDAFAQRFPAAPAFGIWIGREHVVNGGAFFVPPGAAGDLGSLAARFFDARKRPLQMAALAGPDLFLRFAFGLLDIAALERRAERVLGIAAQAVRGCAPELAFDADDHAQYRYACERA